MFDINDPFYQDICIEYTSYKDTDIILSDRINYIYNNDDTKCQQNCKLSKYSEESEYLNCSCSINEEVNNMKEKFNIKKFYESFYDVLKYSNYKVLKCFNLVFTKYVITKNIGSIIALVYILIYLGCLITFIFKGIKSLKDKIKKEKMNKFQVNNINNDNNKNKDEKNLFKIKKKKKIKNRKSFKNNLMQNTTNEKKYIIGIETNKNLDNFELNELDFHKAIIYDNRTLIQIYWSILRREHPILFTFFSFVDYNLIYIKLARFIFLISTDMVMNVFFFSDESMHKLYINYGKYDLVQQIPQILYSTIITKFMEIIICYLSLTDQPIYQIKKLEINNEAIKEKFKCIKIKLKLFFILTFVFMPFYWYAVSSFCSV